MRWILRPRSKDYWAGEHFTSLTTSWYDYIWPIWLIGFFEKTKIEPHYEKSCLCYMWTIKAQISLTGQFAFHLVSPLWKVFWWHGSIHFLLWISSSKTFPKFKSQKQSLFSLGVCLVFSTTDKDFLLQFIKSNSHYVTLTVSFIYWRLIQITNYFKDKDRQTPMIIFNKYNL